MIESHVAVLVTLAGSAFAFWRGWEEGRRGLDVALGALDRLMAELQDSPAHLGEGYSRRDSQRVEDDAETVVVMRGAADKGDLDGEPGFFLHGETGSDFIRAKSVETGLAQVFQRPAGWADGGPSTS